MWIFPRNVLLYWIPIQFIYRYALYHIYDQCINFDENAYCSSASYDLQFCSLSKICSNTIKYSKLVYILKYQRFVLDLAVAKPICYDGFNRNSSDESIYKASRWSRLCPTKEKVPLWLNHAIFRGIIFYETVRLLLLLLAFFFFTSNFSQFF